MQRVISGGVLVAILAVTIWWLPPWATVAVAALAAVLASRELTHLAGSDDSPIAVVPVVVGTAAVTIAFALSFSTHGSNDALVTIVLAALIVVAGALALAAGPPSPAQLARAAISFMAPIYIGLPLGILGLVRLTLGPATLTWLLVVIAVSDTAQYAAGRAFGRRKLAPTISPGKTIEGAIGGVIAAVVAGTLLGFWALPAETTINCAALALVLTAAGMVGDLFESFLKRCAGRKDSASLIPGHGGVMDRIDSHLLAAPVFYLYLVARA